MKLARYTICLIYLVGCSSVGTRSTHKNLKLGVVEKLVPGKTTKSDVLNLLGKANQIVDLESLPHLNDSGEIWEYDESGFTRLSLSFSKNSDRLDSMVWSVIETDPETRLANALRRYKDAKWKSVSEKQTNPHVTPTKCYFISENTGVTVSYSRTQNRVQDISWADPNRVPATRKDAKPKKHVSCIGGNCFEYDPSKLTWQEPPCEIPN